MTFDPTSVEVLCVTLSKDHCVQVPWKYIKVRGYSDLFFTKNLKQRSLTLDDLWPHIFWGHMCDSTQGSLCPSPMGIHQCMWIQWSILQITTYIHNYTYYIHVQIPPRGVLSQLRSGDVLHRVATWVLRNGGTLQPLPRSYCVGTRQRGAMLQRSHAVTL